MGIDSEYLDVAIGVATVFLLVSLAVSGINELIQWIFRARAKFLWAYLYDLVKSPGEPKLPSGARGITSLWRAKNDPRPGPAGQPATNAPNADDPLQRLSAALAPIVAPELTGKAANRQKTAIQHIPPASLAQAFLEVFADVGKDSVANALAALGKTIVARGAPAIDISLTGLEQALSINEPADAAAVMKAFKELAPAVRSLANPTELDKAEVVEAFVKTLEPRIPNVSMPLMRDKAAQYANAVAAANEGGINTASPEFADALIRSFPTAFAQGRIDAAIDGLQGSPLGATARRLWETAKKDIESFRTGLEHHFDSEMTRLSGYYKRSIRVVLITITMLVAVATNLDALRLTSGLWHNPEGRAALLPRADELIAAESAAPTDPGDETAPPSLVALCSMDDEETPDEDPEAVAEGLVSTRTCIDDALTSASELGVIDHAIWSGVGDWWDDWFERSFGNFLIHLLGVIATAAAVIVGAPFWFDVVKRLTGVRKGLVGQT